MSVCLSHCLSLSLSVCLTVSLSVCLSVCMSVCPNSILQSEHSAPHISSPLFCLQLISSCLLSSHIFSSILVSPTVLSAVSHSCRSGVSLPLSYIPPHLPLNSYRYPLDFYLLSTHYRVVICREVVCETEHRIIPHPQQC